MRFSTSFPAPDMIGTYVIKSWCPLEFWRACGCFWSTYCIQRGDPNRTPVSSMANCWWAGSFSTCSPTIDFYAAKYNTQKLFQVFIRAFPLSAKMVLMSCEKVINPSQTQSFSGLKHSCCILEQVAVVKGKITRRQSRHHWTSTSSWALGIFCFVALKSSMLW